MDWWLFGASWRRGAPVAIRGVLFAVVVLHRAGEKRDTALRVPKSSLTSVLTKPVAA